MDESNFARLGTDLRLAKKRSLSVALSTRRSNRMSVVTSWFSMQALRVAFAQRRMGREARFRGGVPDEGPLKGPTDAQQL